MMLKIFFLLSSVGYVLMPKECFSTTLYSTSSLGHFYFSSFLHTHMLSLFLLIMLSAFAEPFQTVYSGKDHDYPAHALAKEHFITPCNNTILYSLAQ